MRLSSPERATNGRIITKDIWPEVDVSDARRILRSLGYLLVTRHKNVWEAMHLNTLPMFRDHELATLVQFTAQYEEYMTRTRDISECGPEYFKAIADGREWEGAPLFPDF